MREIDGSEGERERERERDVEIKRGTEEIVKRRGRGIGGGKLSGCTYAR